MEKTCFVIMGFGKKMDYRNAKMVDLDLIYKKVIKKLFQEEQFKEYKLIRADEISSSEIIDISMYTLLMKADLVIADISTSNENALYELGIRHALKPYSTIIMMQKSENFEIPFDLSHNRILSYSDYGEELDEKESEEIRSNLRKFVSNSESAKIDSPFYTYLPGIKPPTIDENEYRTIVKEAIQKDNTISKLVKKAEELKNKSKFEEAVKIWGKLHEIIPKNEYIIQQLAFAIYKSKKPNKRMALWNALKIINQLNPENSLDLETLGISGAIYKRLFLLDGNYDYLSKAKSLYERGYIIKRDYYNGENLANCQVLALQKEKISEEERNYLIYSCKKIYTDLIEIIEKSLGEAERNYWMYATMATSCLCVGKKEMYKEYEEMFLESAIAEWEKETYYENLKNVKICLKIDE